MTWKSFPAAEAHKQLAKFARALRKIDCIAHFAPYPHPSITVAAFPDWKVLARRLRDVGPGREIMRFYGVSGIEISTQDTLVHGAFSGMAPEGSAEIPRWRLVVQDLDGGLQSVAFSFARCELDAGFLRGKRKRKKRG